MPEPIATEVRLGDVQLKVQQFLLYTFHLMSIEEAYLIPSLSALTSFYEHMWRSEILFVTTDPFTS